MADDPSLQASIIKGLFGRCPRCGKGRCSGFLALRPRCEHCGLDYSFVDSADGPAFFVMFISGFIVAGSALAVEMLYAPPYWVHALLWVPLILITTLLPLRPIKGLLIALQYHHKAAESRLRRRCAVSATPERPLRAGLAVPSAVRARGARNLRRPRHLASSSARPGRKR